MPSLGINRQELTHLSLEELKEAILERRWAIRFHRDQKGDDRCWLDDFVVWGMLSDSSPEPKNISPEAGMVECILFFNHRRTNTPDPTPKDAALDKTDWDSDLKKLSQIEHIEELEKIQKAIKTHRDIYERPRTFEDDRALYRILREKIPADFRLPPREDFIDGTIPGSGCPNFWKSHNNCECAQGTEGAHNYHTWGPCC